MRAAGLVAVVEGEGGTWPAAGNPCPCARGTYPAGSPGRPTRCRSSSPTRHGDDHRRLRRGWPPPYRLMSSGCLRPVYLHHDDRRHCLAGATGSAHGGGGANTLYGGVSSSTMYHRARMEWCAVGSASSQPDSGYLRLAQHWHRELSCAAMLGRSPYGTAILTVARTMWQVCCSRHRHHNVWSPHRKLARSGAQL